jgi:hypothetical protein
MKYADPKDQADVEGAIQRSAVSDPQERRETVQHEYRQAKHLEAAAHHLKGASEAQRRGEQGAMSRHRLFYELHRRSLGLHKEPGVNAGIRARLAGAKIDEHTTGFTPHPADSWVL